jgi:hypothetical protein
MYIFVEAIIGEDAIQNKGQKPGSASSQVAVGQGFRFRLNGRRRLAAPLSRVGP